MASIYLYPSASYPSPLAPRFRGDAWSQDDFAFNSPTSYGSFALDSLGYAIPTAHIEAEARDIALSRARARARAQAQAQAEAEIEARRYHLLRYQQEREREKLRLQRAQEARVADVIARHIAQAQYEAERQEKIRQIAALNHQQQQRLALEWEHQRRVEAAKKRTQAMEADKARESLKHQHQRVQPSFERLILPTGFQQFLGPFLGSFMDIDANEEAPELATYKCCVADKKPATTAPAVAQSAQAPEKDAQHNNVEGQAATTVTTGVKEDVTKPQSAETPTLKGKEKAPTDDAKSAAPTTPSLSNVEDILPDILQHFLGPFFQDLKKTQGSEQAGPSSLRRCPAFKTAQPSGKSTSDTATVPESTSEKTTEASRSDQAQQAAASTTSQSNVDPVAVAGETKAEETKKTTRRSPTRSVPVGSVAPATSKADPPTTAATSEPSKIAPSSSPADGDVGNRATSPTPSNQSGASHSSTALTDDLRGRSRSPKRARVSDVDENGEEVVKDQEEEDDEEGKEEGWTQA